MKLISNTLVALLVGTAALLVGGCQPQDPTIPQSAIAARAMNDKDYSRAILSYTAAIQTEGDIYDFRLNRGKCYAAIGDDENAVTDCTKALALRPGSMGEIAPLRGPALARLGEYDKALADLEAALTADPDNAMALHYRGLALYAAKRYDEALEDLQRAERGLPKGSATVRENARVWSLCLFRLKKYGASQAIYISRYFLAKERAGERLTDDDYHWAGALADVNLDDSARDAYWSKLSRRYRKQKGLE